MVRWMTGTNRSRATTHSDDEHEKHDADENDAAADDEHNDQPVRKGPIVHARDPLDPAAEYAAVGSAAATKSFAVSPSATILL